MSDTDMDCSEQDFVEGAVMSEDVKNGGVIDVAWCEPPEMLTVAMQNPESNVRPLRLRVSQPRVVLDRPAQPTGELLLMSRENPHGWKLEDLLDQLIAEMKVKTDRLHGQTTPIALRVISNNRAIMDRLHKCALMQRDTLHALDTLGPNEGPLGKPRL